MVVYRHLVRDEHAIPRSFVSSGPTLTPLCQKSRVTAKGRGIRTPVEVVETRKPARVVGDG